MFINSAPKACESCISKDYHINSLKEQIEAYRNDIDKLQNRLEAMEKDVMNHFMPKLITSNINTEYQSMPQKGGIRQKIMRAEHAEKDDALTARRQEEYNKRINALLNPETVVVEDAI